MTAFNRRISLSDLERPDAIELQPPPPEPPKYFDYKAGGRDEFFRDLDAYQAAAQIHASHAQNGSAVSPGSTTEAPSYESIGDAQPTISETKIFKKRLLTTLRDIREFIEERRRKPTWSNCFGLSEKVQMIVSFTLVMIIIGAIIALALKYQQIAGLLALSIFFVVFASSTFFIFRKYILKQQLIEALQVGLARVEVFEKMDDKTLRNIKKGVSATLNPMFWINNERRMEEAIPEHLQAPTGTAETTATEPPPPPPPPLTPPPAATAPRTDATTSETEPSPLPPPFSNPPTAAPAATRV